MPQKSTDLSFIGRNIRQLRRQRGWTIGRLARKGGVAEVALGRIERGENAPSAAVLLSVSRALGVSVGTLFSEEPEELAARQLRDAEIPFVPDRPVEKFPPTLLSSIYELIDAVCSLEDICTAQKHARIPLNIHFEPGLRGIADLAEAARAYMGIGNGIVFDYIELFETMGFRVIFLPLPKETPSLAFYDMENQNAFFFIRKRENPERQIFHLVYGLGRIFFLCWANRMGRNPFPAGDEAYSGFCGSEYTEQEEAEKEGEKPLTMHRAARKFAAFFLMPESAVRATVGQLGIGKDQWSFELLLRIKHRFGVSAESFLFRLKELDLVDRKLHDRFRSQIRDHYKKTGYAEPGESRRILNINGRVWDLALIALQKPGAAEEAKQIESTLNKWKVVKF